MSEVNVSSIENKVNNLTSLIGLWKDATVKSCRICAYPEHSLYMWLMPQDRDILDGASGGALVDKTLEAVTQLIENITTCFNNSA